MLQNSLTSNTRDTNGGDIAVATQNVPLDPWTVVGGVAIGLVTALIFGLMPIVQAANIRPLNVIRELPESRGVSRVALTIILLVILSFLFCALAIVILNNDVVQGIEAVYGTFAFLFESYQSQKPLLQHIHHSHSFPDFHFNPINAPIAYSAIGRAPPQILNIGHSGY